MINDGNLFSPGSGEACGALGRSRGRLLGCDTGFGVPLIWVSFLCQGRKLVAEGEYPTGDN